MEKLSVVIITFNEEKNIGRCIDSVTKIADEIIVLDSFSSDNTIAIANSKGAVVQQEKFAGYIEQKNRALSYSSNRFVLSLDADEAIDEVLEKEILAAKNSFVFDGYLMNRFTCYCGKFIKHGSWYPDIKLRLFDISTASWGGINPHDKVIFKKGGRIMRLKGNILHYSYNNLEEHISQNNKFSTIAAEAYFKKGKKSNWFRMLLHPCWAFVQSYFFRLGLLDGFYGFVIAKNIAHLTFMKYYKLYALQKGIAVKPAHSGSPG
jgi:glycosyltransferase involved in cell wall biosynthesis